MGELVEEYKANVAMWQHEDSVRQQRNQTFLASNSALLVVTGLVINATEQEYVWASSILGASMLGLALCLQWRNIQARHHAYLRFRGFQLRDLERALGFTTFVRGAQAFHHYEPVTSADNEETFPVVEGREAKGASHAEARLPVMMAALWAVGLLVGVAVLLVDVL